MKASTGIALEENLLDLLRRIAEEDRRTVSDTIAIWVEAEATKRGWVKEPKKSRKGGSALSAVT